MITYPGAQLPIIKFQDERRQKEGGIGVVMDHAQREDRIHIKSKTVSFSWQRGNKIGRCLSTYSFKGKVSK